METSANAGDDTPVRVECDGGVMQIILNRPQRRNALDLDAWTILADAIESANADHVGAVVLSGRPPAFCSGADLSSFGEGRRSGVYGGTGRLSVSHRFFRDLYRMQKPVIAAVDGAAVGVGWSLAQSCDLVIAGRGAFFSAPFLDRGFIPDGGIAWLLERAIGGYRARHILMVSGRIDALEAHQLGLVSQLVEPGEASATALAIARRLVDGPRQTIEIYKRLSLQAQHAGYEDFLDIEKDMFALNQASGNPAEGVAAYREKRAPQFK